MEKLTDSMQMYRIPSMNNPFLLKDMNKALHRIIKAVNSREKIVIYGYYDFDGIAAVSLLLLILKFLNADVEYFIPDSIDYDYNINSNDIESHINFLGAGLIITVGCGANSLDEIKLCKKLGIDIIITDYHKCKYKTPNTIMVNPNRLDCSYPFKELSSVGIAYKLVESLSVYYRMKCIDKYMDLVMLGTISKHSSIKDENLHIVREGLKHLKNTNNYGLRALIDVSDDVNLYDLKNLTYSISKVTLPVNKIDNSRIAVELFTTNNEDRANQIAKYLNNEINFTNYNFK